MKYAKGFWGWIESVFFPKQILLHPYEYGIAWALMFSGLSLMANGHEAYGLRSSETLEILVFSAWTSALFIMIGLHWKGKRAIGLAIERIGHLFSAFTWGFQTVITYQLLEEFTWQLGVSASLMIAALVKLVWNHRETKKYLRAYHLHTTISKIENRDR